jgi:periplasmic divalent cation tolerance protein
MTEAAYLLIISTTDSKAAAEEMARVLVERRLAACVQVLGPIRSTYRWQEKLETAEEWQCQIKSRAECYADIEKAIRALHSYEVPEIISIPIIGGSSDYLEWLNANTRP